MYIIRREFTMEELIAVLNQFGVTALWGIILYEMLGLVKIVVIFGLGWYGLKKAWPSIKEILDL